MRASLRPLSFIPQIIVPTVVLGIALTACEEKIDVQPSVQAPGKVLVLDEGGVEGDTGWWPSLTIDRHDIPHLSYCDAHRGDLRYATKHHGVWQTQVVLAKGAVGKYTAIATSPQGEIGIAFYDQDAKLLRFAHRRNIAPLHKSPTISKEEPSPWEIERVAWGPEIGMASELRYDADGIPHLFYYIPSGKLIHAVRKQPGDWKRQVIEQAVGSWTVRIDAVLRPEGFWVSFVDRQFKDTRLLLARPAPSPVNYTTEVIADIDGPGWRSQLVFADNQPLLFYSLTLKPHLRLAYRHNNEWRHALLTDHSANFAAAATSGVVLIAYEDTTHSSTGSGSIHLLRRENSTWRRFSVDQEGPTGSYLAVALNSRGQAVVAYYATEIRGLKVYDETP
ncbi:MAG: hypothetical protein R3C68_01400 [Myxococcota bacterium]